MHAHFERTGDLMELSTYPTWAQDLVTHCEETKQGVIGHGIWTMMREARLDAQATRDFMVGVWPVIERFPAYMAQNLLKTRYGRSQGENMARRWLVRNIRVEQNHADYWLNWAEGAGVSRDDVLNGPVPYGSEALAGWCEEVSRSAPLAAGMIATNYAVEGATGEWSQLVYDSLAYHESLPQSVRAHSLRWLQLHAAYDDTHPWEALEIVCTLVGTSPRADQVAYLQECVKRSYVSMRITLDRCLDVRRDPWLANEAAA
ncbi:TenA family transcriptional regulator [Dyella dinghuensis]|uniref:TenA family transcriptional regulator n=1 Tax=Dyella dinghuensis TaxID=1920169 RepID=A0A432LX58_9GAMM|nr:iron-containing redox enzyme family protein [Dyella dinghuensis]RUL66654.1 TenA family transcriptional regulator [Dyella dinghuensis]